MRPGFGRCLLFETASKHLKCKRCHKQQHNTFIVSGTLFLYDPVPHFSTFGKNYTRRFKDTDLFEQIFQHILEECYRFKLVDPTEIFVDATHVKARANNKKMQRRIAQQEALFYADMLRKDINADREKHGKKPLKIKMIIISPEPMAMINLKTIRMTFR